MSYAMVRRNLPYPRQCKLKLLRRCSQLFCSAALSSIGDSYGLRSHSAEHDRFGGQRFGLAPQQLRSNRRSFEKYATSNRIKSTPFNSHFQQLDSVFEVQTSVAFSRPNQPAARPSLRCSFSIITKNGFFHKCHLPCF